MKIKERFKDAILVFMTPPSATELYNRLKGRNTESQDVIMARMARAIEESKGMGDYDYLLINDTVDACVCDLQDIVLGRAKQLKDKDTIIKNIQAGLAEIVEGE